MSQINQVTTANTFGEFIARTGDVIALLNLLSDGGTTTNANLIIARSGSSLILGANNGNTLNQIVIPGDGTSPYISTDSNNVIWTKNNDGVGSGLDADLLDGLTSAYFTNLTAAVATNVASAWATANTANTTSIAANSNAFIALAIAQSAYANSNSGQTYANANFLQLNTTVFANSVFVNTRIGLVEANVIGAAIANVWNGAVNGRIGATTANSASFSTVNASSIISSTVIDGNTWLSIVSKTMVANLNSNTLQGNTWASPQAFGSVNPNDIDASRVRETANDYGVILNAATVTLEMNKYSHFIIQPSTTTSNTMTIAISGAPVAGKTHSFYLEIKGGLRSVDAKITWPSAFKWIGGPSNRPLDTTLASVASGNNNIFAGFTRDGGNRYEFQHVGVSG